MVGILERDGVFNQRLKPSFKDFNFPNAIWEIILETSGSALNDLAPDLFCLMFLSNPDMPGVAQLVEHRTQDSMTQGSKLSQEHKKKIEFFQVKNVVLTRCRCVCPIPVCTRMHNYHIRTLKIL